MTRSSFSMVAFLIAMLLAMRSTSTGAFYLPGSYSHKYLVGDTLSVKVNSLTSIDTEIPFSYYSMPFCRPMEGIKDSAENLGELLMGDRIENSPYRFKMYQNESDIIVCRTKALSAKDLGLLKKRIDEMYQVNLILDNLPAIRYLNKNEYSLKWTGYPVGVKVQDAYYLFNQVKTFTPGEVPQNAEASKEVPKATAPTAEQITAIKAAIVNSQTLEEVARLEQALKTGQLPADLLIPEDDTAVAAATVNEEDSNQMDIDDTTSKSLDKSKRNEEPRKTDSPISIDAD